MKSVPLTLRNSRSENIRVVPIVVAELKLGHVERQIFAADLVIAAHDAAFNQRPETLNRIGVNCTDYMLADAVIDNAVIVAVAEAIIGWVGVSAEQADS